MIFVLLGVAALGGLAYAIVRALEGRGHPRPSQIPEPTGGEDRAPRFRVLPVAVGGIVGTAMLAALLLGTGNDDVGGMLVFFAVVGAMGLGAWFFLFSGRVRTATPSARKRLWHALFLGFFAVYALGLGGWFVAGLATGIAGNVDGLHERLHKYGGAPNVVTIKASDVGPFSIEGSQRIREITLRAGTLTTIEFTAAQTVDKRAIPHNIAILDGAERIFTSAQNAPRFLGQPDEYGDLYEDVTIFPSFRAPGEGFYTYRCDLHPTLQNGTVRVLPASAPLTDPNSHQGLRDMARRMAEVSHQAEGPLEIVADYLFSLISFGLGIFLVILRPRERTARVFGLAMIGTAAAYNLQSHGAAAVASVFNDPIHSILHPLTGIMYVYALILFPDGHLVPRWSNRYLRIAYRAAVFVAVMIMLDVTGAFEPNFGAHPAALVVVFGMVIPLIGIAAQSYRLRRATTSEARQQSRLLVWALATAAILGVALFALGGFDLGTLINPTQADPTLIGSVESRAFRVFQPLFVVIPVALFVGIMRFRLWDIDLVISRALVYGTLAALIGSAYVGVVVGLGGAIGSQTGLSIAVTVAVALAFDPLRSRLQRLANRLIYGERASPYDVLSEMAHRLAGASSPDEALDTIAEAAGRAVGGVRARARLELPDRDACESFWQSADGDAPFDRTVDVVHQDRKIGDISVAKRIGDPLRPAENRLLEALAGQVGLALQSLRLAEQLRIRLAELEVAARELSGSRGRLMRAADAERRRLEQLIHEGVERELQAIGDALKIAEEHVARDALGAVDELERIAEQANHTQEALRGLARGIFPPLLSDKGVGAALQSHLRKMEATVTMSGTLDERFDARAEAAVYFCCIEALRPMSRASADATAATVELARENGWVRFAVRNTAGLTATSAEVQLLVDRIEAVGGTLVVHTSDGQTEVAGRVPARSNEAEPVDQIDDQTLVSLSGSKADFGT
ncbi:MAG: hypothetical protein WEB06_14235 [Actinomycetota bacterium]